MFSLRFSVILLFILFVPFVLRIFHAEPYPALLLPAEAIKITKKENRVFLEGKDIYAMDYKGNWQKWDPNYILYPIPIAYLQNLISDNFRFDFDSSRFNSAGFKLLKKFHLANKKNISSREVDEIKSWLRKKLIKQGLSPSTIKFTNYTLTISTETGAVLENKIKNERIVSLAE